MSGLSQVQEALRVQMIHLYLGDTRVLPTLHFLAQPIGLFYGRFAHRLLTHLILAACLLSGAFLVAALSNGSAFVTGHLPMTCALALHLALTFTFGHAAADMLANRLLPRRMAYGRRSIGGQWLVVFGGLALGFLLYRATLGDLMMMCAPLGWQAWPQPWQPDYGHLLTRLPLAALGCAAIYANIFMLLMSSSEAWLRGAVDLVRPEATDGKSLTPSPASGADTAGARIPSAEQPLNFSVNGLEVVVSPADISHVSVEDHYCRIHYQRGREAKEVLVREALARLARRLPPDQFIRIHRSHLVNRERISGFFRRGRSHGVTLQPSGARLPLSRRRYQELKAQRPEVFRI